MKRLLGGAFAIILLLSLSGCFGGAGNLVVPNEMIDGTVESVSNITDASVMKEAIVHKTLQNQDKMIALSNSKPSVEMGWQSVEETVFYPGMAAPMVVKKAMPTMKYTEKQAFNHQRPQAPSEHPGWKYGTDAVKTIAQYSFYGWLSHGLFEMVKEGWSMVGDKHNGDNYQSNNGRDGTQSTAEPFVFGAEPIAPEVPAVL